MSADADQTVLSDLGLRPFQLYIFFGTPSGAWDIESESTHAVLADHVGYLRDVERTGVVFMGAPFRAPDYDWDGSGVIAVRAASPARAREIVRREPLFVHGLRTYEVRGWQLNEGRLVLTVDLDSDRIGLA